MDVSQIAAVQQGNSGTIPPVKGMGQPLSGSAFKEVLEARVVPKVAPKTYAVRQGDTLTQIVRDALRRQGKTFTNSELYAEVRAVAAQNRMPNPDLIHPGQQLDLSSLMPEVKTLPVVAVASPKVTPVVTPPSPPVQEDLEANLQTIGRMSKNLIAVLEEIMQPLRGTAPASPPAAPSRTTPWRQTLEGAARLTSGYGMRKDPFTGKPAFHHGVDLAAKSGTPVHAYQEGTVTFSGWQRGYGRTVIVEHADGSESVYAHCSKSYVKEGQQVNLDTPIAAVGASGRATGPHLHFELRSHGKSYNPMPSLLAGLTRNEAPGRG